MIRVLDIDTRWTLVIRFGSPQNALYENSFSTASLVIIKPRMFAITSRLKALPSWLAEARYVWLSLAVIAIALFVSLRPHTSEPVIRITGLILQLLGIGTVIWGISETRTLFGHPSFASKTTGWFKRFPLLHRDVVLGAGMSTQGSVTSRGRGYITHVPKPSPTVEARLEALENNVTSIHERISQTQNEMDQGFQKTEEALKLEQQARQTEERALHEKLEATGTGGVHISAIGASWLFVGVILSTAAIEIAEFNGVLPAPTGKRLASFQIKFEPGRFDDPVSILWRMRDAQVGIKPVRGINK